MAGISTDYVLKGSGCTGRLLKGLLKEQKVGHRGSPQQAVGQTMSSQILKAASNQARLGKRGKNKRIEIKPTASWVITTVATLTVSQSSRLF